ncbi:MAG: hypothetical protein VX899_17055 [Myxococcota bacterium]|nr:hypothetical protein [Myxococcota bacterium]
MSRPLRVHFVHGLESGPTSGKVSGMKDLGLEVSAPDMHMSIWRMDKRNSMVRNLLRMWQPWTAALMLLGALPMAIWGNPWSAGAMFLGAILWGRLRNKAWVAQALDRSRSACVEIQKSVLKQASPDVVVGSSWGGAVLIELVLQGAWEGPVLLMAPALERVEGRINPAAAAKKRARLHQHPHPIRILHAPEDEVVPYADSELLAHGDIVLTPVPGDDHRLLGTLQSGVLIRELEALAGREHGAG